jgi:hypothetical protein
MIHCYSSRRSPLKDFLAIQLQGARRYDRIAGFFLLLATATPVQLDQIEAWDLLDALNEG